MEVFATVYRAELKRFGVDVVVAVAGNMKTGGPAKTAAALARTAERMTAEERGLYGRAFGAFAAKLNGMQSDGLASGDAAKRVIELESEVARLQQELADARSEIREAVAKVHRHYRRDLVPLDTNPVRWLPNR